MKLKSAAFAICAFVSMQAFAAGLDCRFTNGISNSNYKNVRVSLKEQPPAFPELYLLTLASRGLKNKDGKEEIHYVNELVEAQATVLSFEAGHKQAAIGYNFVNSGTGHMPLIAHIPVASAGGPVPASMAWKRINFAASGLCYPSK